MNYKLTIMVFFIFMVTGFSCASSPDRVETVEISGKVIAPQKSKGSVYIELADGNRYELTGKLKGLIGDFYKGATVRVKGEVEKEAKENATGSFAATELILEIE